MTDRRPVGIGSMHGIFLNVGCNTSPSIAKGISYLTAEMVGIWVNEKVCKFFEQRDVLLESLKGLVVLRGRTVVNPLRTVDCQEMR